MSHLCPNKELCGSCGWSHIPYETQLIQKVSDINGSFKLKDLDLKCKNILPSPKQTHYRNRMDYVIDFEGRVGMRQKDRWWKVLDNHKCFLADEYIDGLYDRVREWVRSSGLSYYDRKSHVGLLRFAIIRTTSSHETMIIILTSPPKDHEEETQLRKEFKKLVELSNPTTLVWGINSTMSDVSFGETYETIHGQGYIREQINELIYRVSPNAFFQTNSSTSPILLETVKTFCGDLSAKTVLDLYCGTGLFSIAFAKESKKMIGIELNENAIVDAKINAEINNVSPEFLMTSAETFDWSVFKPDLIILDPPRSGMHDDTLRDIIKYLPKEIVYVSCNFKNFAREMVFLKEFYTVSDMIAIDQFPHTPHVELITKLELK